MKRFILVLAFCLLPCLANAKGGGTSVAPCTATPPSQASAAGLTVLKACETFATNQDVDIQNTKSPVYDWFTQNNSWAQTTVTSNDGTGFSFLCRNASTEGKCMSPATNSGTTSIGFAPTGSFYVELDMKFDPSLSPGSGSDPSFFIDSQNTALYGAVPSSYPYDEVDIIECETTGVPGAACISSIALIKWAYQGVGDCGTAGGVPGGMPSHNYAHYNTYGLLHLASTDNGGTGLITWYFTNGDTQVTTILESCTYSATAAPHCQNETNSCTTGDIMEFDTQPVHFQVGAWDTGGLTTIRNFHVWQLH